jgi:hypothetical protein
MRADTLTGMDAAVVVALIALIGTVGNAGLSYMLNVRSENRRERQKADAVWSRYRKSLTVAATDLADRIYNVLHHHLFEAYAESGQKNEVVLSTLFRFAQYFGWSEVLRQSLLSPDPRHADEARRLEEAQARVGRAFASDRYGAGAFMLWREAQRAIGEQMITRKSDTLDTIGVAGFLTDFEKFKPWLRRMQQQLETEEPVARGSGEHQRLADVHDALRAFAGDEDLSG